MENRKWRLGILESNQINKDYNRPFFTESFKDFIWLPTQEQLQEMVKKRHIYYLIKDFQIFQVKHTIGLHINNMNELWLAFIMYQLYNKRWTGKDWITIESTNSPNQKE